MGLFPVPASGPSFLSAVMAPPPTHPAPTFSLFVLRGRYDMTQYPHWYSWNSAALANQDWIFPEQGSCMFLYTFHHFCQLMSLGQLVIYNTGFDASRISSKTLWSKKGSWRAQKASHHQTRDQTLWLCISALQITVQMASHPGINAPAAVILCDSSSAQIFIDYLFLYARHCGYSETR